MTSLRKRIEEAAFWDGFICLECGFIEYDERQVYTNERCPQCDSLQFLRATAVKGIVARVDEEEDECD